MPHKVNKEIVQLKQRLKKECKGDLGFVNPYKAFSFLNTIQKEDCPEAYEPEIVTIHKRKKQAEQRRNQLINDIDKTLFDFDDEIDKLSEVSERYKIAQEAENQANSTLNESLIQQNRTIQDQKFKTLDHKIPASLFASKQKPVSKRNQCQIIRQTRRDAGGSLEQVKSRLKNDAPVQSDARSQLISSKCSQIRYSKAYLRGAHQESQKLVENIWKRRNIFNHINSIADQQYNEVQQQYNNNNSVFSSCQFAVHAPKPSYTSAVSGERSDCINNDIFKIQTASQAMLNESADRRQPIAKGVQQQSQFQFPTSLSKILIQKIQGRVSKIKTQQQAAQNRNNNMRSQLETYNKSSSPIFINNQEFRNTLQQSELYIHSQEPTVMKQVKFEQYQTASPMFNPLATSFYDSINRHQNDVSKQISKYRRNVEIMRNQQQRLVIASQSYLEKSAQELQKIAKEQIYI